MYNIGNVFGDFTIIGTAPMPENTHTRKVRVRCNICGREQEVYTSSLKKRSNTHESICSKLIFINNELEASKDSRFYKIWSGMRYRTNDINNQYYGAKGINSDAFENFVSFFDTMHESYEEHVKQYGEKNTTIDRIDPDKDYTPENCRWATIEEQNGNKSDTINFSAISPDGYFYCGTNLMKFCNDHNLVYGTVLDSIIQNGGFSSNLQNGWRFSKIK